MASVSDGVTVCRCQWCRRCECLYLFVIVCVCVGVFKCDVCDDKNNEKRHQNILTFSQRICVECAVGDYFERNEKEGEEKALIICERCVELNRTK